MCTQISLQKMPSDSLPITSRRCIARAWGKRVICKGRGLTGSPKPHITGEHLLLPGYDDSHPTLEIFSYDSLRDTLPPEVNRPGFAHIAFEVDEVETTLAEIVAAGGGQVGEVVTAAYPNGMEAVFVYARDPEGNIIELQSWRKMQTN